MHTKVNESTFAGQPIYVGIDVHLKSWKVTVMAGDIYYKTFSAPPEADKLANYLRQNFPGGDYYSAYEAGFCGFSVHRELTACGIKSIVVNPADIPTTDKERRQKEDQRDSRKIAKSLQTGQVKPIFVPSEKTLHDRTLLRNRDTIVKDITRNKNRVKSLLYLQGIRIPERYTSKSYWSNGFLQWLGEIIFEHNTGRSALDALLAMVSYQRSLLLKVTRQIRELSKTPHYQENVSLLVSVPGIGPLTAMRLLTELEPINRFSNFSHLCSFVGFIPATDSTGDTEKVTGISPRKNSRLRVALIESAWIAIGSDPALLHSYQTLRKRMPANTAITRIAKKLLRRITHVLRTKQTYERGIIE
jgi:transposase